MHLELSVEIAFLFLPELVILAASTVLVIFLGVSLLALGMVFRKACRLVFHRRVQPMARTSHLAGKSFRSVRDSRQRSNLGITHLSTK
jgi:hypothetical protein